MKRVIALVAALVTAGALFTAGAPASAAPKTFASIVGTVKIDPSDPTAGSIRVLYRCTTEDHTSPHSFVSVKQVGDRSLDRALAEEGSSELAITSGGAWAMSHRNAMNCDSKIHVQTFLFDQIETSSFGAPIQPLAPGFGYIQFCIFDDNYPIPAPPADPDSGVPYDQTAFRLVK